MTITKSKQIVSSDTTSDAERISPEQRHFLLEAKAWWQEGDRALDYLAERARLQSRTEQIESLLTLLHREPVWNAGDVLPLLPLLRSLSANRAINRGLATDTFAQALRSLLLGEAPLPSRLTVFLETQRVGEQTASQFLYAAMPERYPLVSPATRTVLTPTAAQRSFWQEAAREQFGSADVEKASAAVRGLLANFALYEAAKKVLGVESFVDVNAILWHAREMPKNRTRPSHVEATFATATNSAPVTFGTARVREGVAWYGTEPFGDGEPKRTTEPQVVDYLENFIASQGFTFPALAVRDYYVALKTKPFVILSGISGTGKTRLTELMAEALTGNLSGQYLLTPVRPDWTDSSALLGYQNLLTDTYVSTPFLEKLIVAAQPENRERAFFLCLDEMNLSSPNHYLSEILSAMETTNKEIFLQGFGKVRLPPNLFIIGTMNVDEASHTITKKVLDRANTIEFVDVDFRRRAVDQSSHVVLPDIPARERQRMFLASRVLSIRDAEARLAACHAQASFPITQSAKNANERIRN